MIELRHPEPSTLRRGVQQTAAIHERLPREFCFIADCDLPQHGKVAAKCQKCGR